MDKKKDATNKRNRRGMTALAITSAILGCTTLGFGIGYGVMQSRASDYGTRLENIYQSNFYSTLDSVNNLETKLSKVLASNSSDYQRKTLLQASQNASETQISVASLPLKGSEREDTIKLVNQVGGYTQTLADDLIDRQMTEEERGTLEEIYASILALKEQLNDFARKIENDYSILNHSLEINGDSNTLMQNLSALKRQNIEYPTMIYDGPFSDSVVNSEIKGLKGDVVSKEEVKEQLLKMFKDASSIVYEGETNGRFETYNFRLNFPDGGDLFLQATKIGGHVLTLSGAGQNGEASIDKAGGGAIALEFAKANGIEGGEIVWSDNIKEEVYFNIAPTQDRTILYPDLVKVKVDMVSGRVVGYDATSYFTNHRDRSLSRGSLSLSSAKGKVPSIFEILKARVVLAPLDYNREVVCVEVEAEKEGDTYYFFFNVDNGDMENILKVIKTDDGNLLM